MRVSPLLRWACSAEEKRKILLCSHVILCWICSYILWLCGSITSFYCAQTSLSGSFRIWQPTIKKKLGPYDIVKTLNRFQNKKVWTLLVECLQYSRWAWDFLLQTYKSSFIWRGWRPWKPKQLVDLEMQNDISIWFIGYNHWLAKRRIWMTCSRPELNCDIITKSLISYRLSSFDGQISTLQSCPLIKISLTQSFQNLIPVI